jgi:pantetheine-phosphate adenylyltransferase
MALYAGSFDPPHLGHLDLIERAAATFGQLVVVVATNPTKGSGLLAIEERTSLLHRITLHLDNVEVVKHEGLLVELVRTRGVDVIIRGIGREPLGELEMAEMNARL